MAPFLVLVSLFVLLSILGYFHLPVAFGWWTALRFSLAGMFLLTASAHWGKRRPDLIRMVPPQFPSPGALVTLTGLLELLGAAGLLIPRTAPYAALGLALLLIVLFPANIHAARRQLTIAGHPVPALFPRTLLQLVFVAAALAVFFARPTP
ncbi:MAG TPA: DoxX family membrane protein [Bryobacteraceae bacterium]|jgi:uncharacterized membrane protein|nr:DoxX family membrane protein [Bryobacteraceae bacterium]